VHENDDKDDTFAYLLGLSENQAELLLDALQIAEVALSEFALTLEPLALLLEHDVVWVQILLEKPVELVLVRVTGAVDVVEWTHEHKLGAFVRLELAVRAEGLDLPREVIRAEVHADVVDDLLQTLQGLVEQEFLGELVFDGHLDVLLRLQLHFGLAEGRGVRLRAGVSLEVGLVQRYLLVLRVEDYAHQFV